MKELNNAHRIVQSRGFTIVELLVVIVVIGILAAITIVSYTGITAKANTTANKNNANSVRRAAQMVYTDSATSTFPATGATSATVVANLNTGSAKIPTGLTVNNAQLAAGATIQYLTNGGAGICIGYWDYSGSGSAVYLYAGNATAGSNVATPTCT